MLQGSDVLNLDESGVRVKGKLHWWNKASNERLTSYEIHTKRGCPALDDAGWLPNFEGYAVHDHPTPYFNYDNCNWRSVMLIIYGNLNWLKNLLEQTWAKDMAAIKLSIKDGIEKTKPYCNHLEPLKRTSYENRSDEIVSLRIWNESSTTTIDWNHKKRGRTKQTPPLNRRLRLRDYKPFVSAFMHDFRVPFNNNQAERDVCQVKVKHRKISYKDWIFSIS